MKIIENGDSVICKVAIITLKINIEVFSWVEIMKISLLIIFESIISKTLVIVIIVMGSYDFILD
jgi:hypothetical protein